MKRVGSCIYYHWRDTTDYMPMFKFEAAQDILHEFGYPDDWDYVKWNGKTDNFTFTWCNDWDGENEPVVVRQVMVAGSAANELPVSKDNPPIIHGKHLFVDEDYEGFDLDEARERWESYQGADWLDKSRMGRIDWWREHAYPRIGK